MPSEVLNPKERWAVATTGFAWRVKLVARKREATFLVKILLRTFWLNARLLMEEKAATVCELYNTITTI